MIEKLTLPGNDAPPLRLRSASTTQLVWRVRRGELQAAFGVLPIIDKTLWIERVAEEPFCVCLPEHHRLANHSRLPARELSEETVAWIPRSFHRLLYDQVMSYLRTLGFSAERFKEAQTITQALDFVAIGTGIALVPQSASRFQRRGVVFRSLTDDLIRIETALFVQKEQMRSSVKDFISAAMSATAFLRHRP